MNYELKALSLFLLLLSLLPGRSGVAADLTHYVSTLQGTHSNFALSHGNTFPATAMPYGVHMWTPQTGPNGEGFKYLYDADAIRGFGQSHQCSPWVSDYAVYTFFPEVGELVVSPDERASRFKHENEVGLPHYYSVLFDNGIRTEFAPTERSVHFCFTYPRTGDAWLLIDGYTGQSEVRVDASRRRVSGWVNNQRFVNHADNFRCYFVIDFDTPFEAFGTWENRGGSVSAMQSEASGDGAGAYLRFRKGAKVEARAASSYISYEQAELTLERELGRSRRLEDTKARGAETWNKLLGRILVEGGSEEQRRTFYSCLFRSNLFSRKFYEEKSDGSPYYYSPYDGHVYDGYMFTDNGFWDTFRSLFPLTCILHPSQQGRYLEAMLHVQSQELGWFPSWSFPGETGGMVGNHSISLFADAWAKGIRTVVADSLLRAYAHEAFNKGPYGGANGRQCWHEYFTLGYVPFPLSHGSVTQTLEYAYDDWCAYRIARQSGDAFWADVFGRQMRNYRNLWDAATGFFRGRGEDGKWYEPFDPLVWGGPYTEGNAWHYIWSVFHDVQGLINLIGSDEAFVARIDSVFSQPSEVKPGWYGYKIHEMTEMEEAGMGQYAHGNQPIQHLAYLYSYAGAPWKTQYWVRQILDRLYDATPDGFPGDEDQGGMSSWYVLSALGLYAVTPGTDQYVIGSPLFPRATITMEDGRKFVIEARDNTAENVYIQEAWLNGKPLLRNYVTYDEITRGGRLVFQMGPEPNLQRCTGKDAAPYSLSLSGD